MQHDIVTVAKRNVRQCGTWQNDRGCGRAERDTVTVGVGVGARNMTLTVGMGVGEKHGHMTVGVVQNMTS